MDENPKPGLAGRSLISAIELERGIGAPADAVFRAWTEPELLVQWLAQRAEVNPGTGGHFRLESDRPGSVPQPYVYSGDYREFVPGRRIVMSWVFNGPRPEDLGESEITVELDPVDSRSTALRFREELSGLATHTERESARQDWLAAFDRLERALTP